MTRITCPSCNKLAFVGVTGMIMTHDSVSTEIERRECPASRQKLSPQKSPVPPKAELKVVRAIPVYRFPVSRAPSFDDPIIRTRSLSNYAERYTYDLTRFLALCLAAKVTWERCLKIASEARRGLSRKQWPDYPPGTGWHEIKPPIRKAMARHLILLAREEATA